MSYSMEIIEVKGHHVLSSGCILGYENAKLEEKVSFVDGETVKVEMSWGLSEQSAKQLKANRDFFSNKESLYLLFSEDDYTYQCLKLLSVEHHQVQYGIQIEMKIDVYDAHQQRVMDYLIRKREQEALRNSYLEREFEKLRQRG